MTSQQRTLSKTRQVVAARSDDRNLIAVAGLALGQNSHTTGLGWTKAAEYVTVSAKPGKDELERCWELGATVAAQLMG